MSRRTGQHILFWGVYYIICLYNELFINKSYSLNPTFSMFLVSSLAVFLLLIIKVIIVYYILYKLLPTWVEDKNIVKLLAKGLLSILAGVFTIRITIHLFIWPYLYEDTTTTLNFLALLARFFYSLLDMFQIVGAAVCIKLYKLRVESIKKEKNLILERSRAEVMHLKSQTNPHFLFNTLNSIYSLARSKSEQTPDTIMRLSKILRYTLYDSEKKTISIGEELKIIKDYIELQQLRFGKRIEIKPNINIDSEFAQVAPLLLLPIIENAYKHCDENNAVIIFDLSLEKNNLNLRTLNPVSKKEVTSHGTGLQNLRRQLELLYKEFTLYYSLKEGLFVLELTINLNTYAGNELFDIGG